MAARGKVEATASSAACVGMGGATLAMRGNAAASAKALLMVEWFWSCLHEGNAEGGDQSSACGVRALVMQPGRGKA